MARSPENEAEAAQAGDAQSAFRRSIVELDQRLHRGEPFSGHERNCAFINTGAPRWAAASHAAGFDFDDDARAIALTDWDGDGDLDLWVTNRTAPMVRFLRNDSPRGGDFLSLDLRGTTANRDAIGAVVEVSLKNDPRPLVRELRAGEGYLSQSSKRLVIGLGPKAVLRDLTVRWPGGARESFGAPAVNGRWQLTQGTGKAVPAAARGRVLSGAATPLPASAEEEPRTVPLSRSLPAPRLDFTTPDGTAAVVNPRAAAQETVLALWSSTCLTCAEELAALVKVAARFSKAGTRLLCLASEESEENKALAAKFATTLPLGRLTDASRARLESLAASVFDLQRPFAVPAAFIFDRDGALAGTARGPADAGELIAAVEKIRLPAATRLAAALPWPGHWQREMGAFPASLELPVFVANQQDFPATADLLASARDHYRRAPGYPAFCAKLGDALSTGHHTADAVTAYREALLTPGQPTAPLVKNNLADLLLATPATAAEALTLATEAVAATQRSHPALLETLARAQAATGSRDAARRTATEALAKTPATDTALQSTLRAHLAEWGK